MKRGAIYQSTANTGWSLARFCLAIGLGFIGLASDAHAGREKSILNQATIEPKTGQSLPLDASFRDHNGEPVLIEDVVRGDHPTILCLVYFECPMLCKLSADGLVRAVASIEEDVGDAFNVAVVSFDPRDTPQPASTARAVAIGKYGRDPAGRGWYFLTGGQKAIERLTDAVGFRYVWDEQTQQFSHAAGLVMVSPEGVITEYLDGVHFVPAELHAALERAADQKIATTTSNNFVRCYLYDPTTGKFGAAIQWSIRIGGLLTVVVLGIAISRMTRRKPTRSS